VDEDLRETIEGLVARYVAGLLNHTDAPNPIQVVLCRHWIKQSGLSETLKNYLPDDGGEA
jgi:hypothetical protein